MIRNECDVMQFLALFMVMPKSLCNHELSVVYINLVITYKLKFIHRMPPSNSCESMQILSTWNSIISYITTET